MLSRSLCSGEMEGTSNDTKRNGYRVQMKEKRLWAGSGMMLLGARPVEQDFQGGSVHHQADILERISWEKGKTWELLRNAMGIHREAGKAGD